MLTTGTASKQAESKMSPNRKIAIIVGVLFIIGTVAGILSAVIAGPILSDPDYLTKISANANPITLRALFILTMGIALAFIPALMFPILKKLSEPLAIGYIIFRGAMETFIAIGQAICWLVLVGVARQYADSGAAVASQLPALGVGLVKAFDPLSAALSIVFSLGALMLYYLLYQARLIPRWISGWGIVAGVLYLTAGLVAILGINWDFLMYIMLPQEMVMAVWLIVKGFNSSAIDSGTTNQEKWRPVAT
jgi:Domain of unknown function (DUF4386)